MCQGVADRCAKPDSGAASVVQTAGRQSTEPMRIGLLGGSFDPPHTGHLLAAGDAFDALSLDRLVFIPTATQPLKVGKAAATAGAAAQRWSALLVGGDARFDVSAIEIDRGGLSYTVDTLAALAERWPTPSCSGWSARTWSSRSRSGGKPARIVELATIVVLQRTGDATRISGRCRARRGVLATRRIDVSSTEIRERVRAGKSIRGFVPNAVAEFIAAERLYR